MNDPSTDEHGGKGCGCDCCNCTAKEGCPVAAFEDVHSYNCPNYKGINRTYIKR